MYIIVKGMVVTKSLITMVNLHFFNDTFCFVRKQNMNACVFKREKKLNILKMLMISFAVTTQSKIVGGIITGV